MEQVFFIIKQLNLKKINELKQELIEKNDIEINFALYSSLIFESNGKQEKN